MFQKIRDYFPLALILSVSAVIMFTTGFYLYSLIRNYFIRKNLRGKTVLITGGTSGVGKELAKLFLLNKFNVIVTGKTEEDLKEALKDLRQSINDESVFLKGFALNFNNKLTIENLNRLFIENEIDPLSVHILINNVSLITPTPQFFLEDEYIEEIIKVNVLNTLKFTKYILRNFMPVDTSTKKCIIFMGSAYADYPTPLLSTYAGSKAFISAFAKSLSYELESRNINVEVIKTLFVATKSSKMGENFISPSIVEYASCIFNTFGSQNINGAYYPHILVYTFLNFVPEFVISSFIFTYNVLMKPADSKED